MLYEDSITQQEHDDLLKEIEDPGVSVQRCREIINDLLPKVKVFGKARYDPSHGDEKLCVCGHVYYRHFDSYENMAPVGCKYCYCETGFKQALGSEGEALERIYCGS